MTEVAAPDQGITPEELQLAARNHGMPLEALRHDLTPPGLHYVLVHFDIPDLDADGWRVQVGGTVRQTLELTLDDLRARPRRTVPVTLECAGNGRARLRPRPLSQPWLHEAVGTAAWTGTPLAGVLDDAGLADDTVEIVFTGADRGIQDGVEHPYQRSLPVAEATRQDVLLAYEMNGRPLLPQHGHPVRLIVPGWYGMASVKWLARIDAADRPFEGFQQARAYRYQYEPDETGDAVTRIRVRALMLPPGIPDFFTRRRVVDAGPVVLRGRAWCGSARVEQVQVGVDGRWEQAQLGEQVGEFAWRAWSYRWEATPGEHVLACRARAADGTTQPVEQPWNLQGMGNNLIQKVAVTVR